LQIPGLKKRDQPVDGSHHPQQPIINLLYCSANERERQLVNAFRPGLPDIFHSLWRKCSLKWSKWRYKIFQNTTKFV